MNKTDYFHMIAYCRKNNISLTKFTDEAKTRYSRFLANNNLIDERYMQTEMKFTDLAYNKELFRIDFDDLIFAWMAEGMIHFNTYYTSPVPAPEEPVKKLLQCFLFWRIYDRHYGNIKKFKKYINHVWGSRDVGPRDQEWYEYKFDKFYEQYNNILKMKDDGDLRVIYEKREKMRDENMLHNR